MPFITAEPIELREVDDKNWVTLVPLTYQGRDESFTVPVGFGTDLASVPRLFRWLIPTYGRFTKSAILHDYFWRTPNVISRSDADGIFRRSMQELGVPLLQRWVMWAAVRTDDIIKPRTGEKRPSLSTVFAVVGILLAVLPIIFIPGIVVLVALAEVWLIEWVAILIGYLVHPFKSKRNRPKMFGK